MKVKEESEKVGLKLNVQKTKIMVSDPLTSWEINGETVETVSDFILLGTKITADGDCSHEIKRCLLLGRKFMTNLDSILKNRHYFANKGPSSQGYDPMDCSPPCSSVHGIFQVRTVELVVISSSRSSSQFRDQTRVS